MNDSGERTDGAGAAPPSESPQPPPETTPETEAPSEDAPVSAATDPPAVEVVPSDEPDAPSPPEPPAPDGQGDSPPSATGEGKGVRNLYLPPLQGEKGPDPLTSSPDTPAPDGPTESSGQAASANEAPKDRRGPTSRPSAGNGRSDGKSPRRPPPKIPWNEPLVLIRYGRMSRVGVFRHNLDPMPQRETQVVIRTDRGVELGTLVSDIAPAEGPALADDCPAAAGADCNGACLVKCTQLAAVSATGGSEINFNRQNKVLRLASPQDLNDQAHLDRSEREKRQFSDQQAVVLGLKMRLVAVEHLLGGERVVFYFTSESRVDFRELVRRLAGQYRTRIEMRQIGARDEARLVADYERCGRQCCCQAFLGTLQPVSIRMAKTQKATLDPSKISGRCNRLMCCLRYEDPTYELLRKTLPKKNIWVRTEEVVGKVVSSQILSQLVRIVDVYGAMSVIDVASILERGVEPPDPNQRPAPRPRRPEPVVVAAPEAADPPAATTAAPAADPEGAPSQEGAGRKRRRRRRRGPKDAEAAAAQPVAAAPARREGTAPAESDQPPRKRRRRRRRSKGDGGAGGGSASPPA